MYMNNEMADIFNEVGFEMGLTTNVISRTINSLYRYYKYNRYPVDICDMTKEDAKRIMGININGNSWKLIEKVKEVVKGESYIMVFLSHKMNGLADDEIFEIRDNAVKYLEDKYKIHIRVLDNFNHKNVPEDAGRIWHLGESIKMMEMADAIYFCPGWMNSKGCQIEYEICRTYNLTIID